MEQATKTIAPKFSLKGPSLNRTSFKKGTPKSRRILAAFFPDLAINLYTNRINRSTSEQRHGQDFPNVLSARVPFVLHEKLSGALRIAHMNAEAAASGIYVGQPFAEARALAPRLEAAACNPVADAKAFEKIVQGFLRYGPHVGTPILGRVCVEVAGSAHLFGGEAGVLEDLKARLSRANLSATAVIADEPATAFAVASSMPTRNAGSDVNSVADRAAIAGHPRGGRNPGWRGELPKLCRSQVARPHETAKGDKAKSSYFNARIISPNDSEKALTDLPVEALDIDPDTVQSLRTLGLKTIGAVRRQPRTALTRRFGAALARRLDAASGAVFESISPITEKKEYSVLIKSASSLMTIDAALETTRALAFKLCKVLESDGLGARRFILHFFRLDNSSVVQSVDLASPSRTPEALVRLFRLKFEKGEAPVDPGFGFDAFRLTADSLVPIEADQRSALVDFAEEAHDQDIELIKLADRLSAVLGADTVRRAQPEDTHDPGRVVKMVPSVSTKKSKSNRSINWPMVTSPEGVPFRPLFALPTPEPIDVIALAPDGPPARFMWRGVSYRGRRASWPERLLGDWCADPVSLSAASRDYYRIEDETGRRFWLFRQGDMGASDVSWHLAGLFA